MHDDLDAVARSFIRFADEELREYAPFYDRLTRTLAVDPGAMAIARQGRSGQAPANLLLAAIHYLLLQGVRHPLAAWYPGIGETTGAGDLAAAARSFCREYGPQLTTVVSTRLVQTNEVSRSAFLLPAFTHIWQTNGERPLALIEVGASAGLNLLFDHYAYDYGSKLRWGDPGAPLLINCEVHGETLPPLPLDPLPVASRLGIDLNPIYANDADETLWLRALVWPEHPERARQLDRALDVARRFPVPLVRGDALEALPNTVATVPRNQTLCVFHSNVLAHFPPPARQRFHELVKELGQGRNYFLLYSQGVRRPGEELFFELRLRRYLRGAESETVLAAHHPHGAWIAWY